MQKSLFYIKSIFCFHYKENTLLIKSVFFCFFALTCFLCSNLAHAETQDIYYSAGKGAHKGILSPYMLENINILSNLPQDRLYGTQTPYIRYFLDNKAEEPKQDEAENVPDNEETKQDEAENVPDNKEMIYGPNPPIIAIVIDDMGINRKMTENIGSLNYPLTVSFLPHADKLQDQIAYSAQNGQEIMLHLPMEPQVMQNYTEDMLTTEMTDDEISQKLGEMLQKIPQAVGANNHMGSKFTEDAHKMGVVMQKLAEKDIIFLDSKTSARTTGLEQSKLWGTKFLARDVFIDNQNDYDYIMSQLKRAENIAHSKGYAIAIGHPKSQTYNALKDWLPNVTVNGLKLVPISKIYNSKTSLKD